MGEIHPTRNFSENNSEYFQLCSQIALLPFLKDKFVYKLTQLQSWSVRIVKLKILIAVIFKGQWDCQFSEFWSCCWLSEIQAGLFLPFKRHICQDGNKLKRTSRSTLRKTLVLRFHNWIRIFEEVIAIWKDIPPKRSGLRGPIPSYRTYFN